ncbi:MAG: FAD-dependent oxidoreductase [Verrucomicrobia bacterium]|nr:FAD-dependent oxidoreductase [Verrucomicrobiota bacterium]
MSKAHYFLSDWIERKDQRLKADICVYGGTAAGVVAAVKAAALGCSAIILHPGQVLGGMTTGGLGQTDFGKVHTIGGMARQFYRDLGAAYGRDEEWCFEPHVAQSVVNRYVQAAGVPVQYGQFLEQVEMGAGRIRRIRMLGGLQVEARVFIDATYEGDLLAKAGVSYTVGRESNSIYGETINGVQIREKHQFSHAVDPYVRPGESGSGLLPRVNAQDAAPMGTGDNRIQAYNFRMCMTDDPDLRIPWERPSSFTDLEYELARRWFRGEKDGYNDQLPNYEGLPQDLPKKFDLLTERTANGFYKTDTNNHGPVSSDFIGANYAWPEATYAERERIFQAHVAYQMGHYWFLANDDAIPDRYRTVYRRFGLARDEFMDTGHWPHQLYVREARRMVADYVLNEHDTQHRRQPEDPVGMGSYAMDSHNCQRVVRDGRVLNEGDVQLPPAAPYGISYRSIVPRRGECQNLLVPICLSASHIAYGSVRMEPVFMILGESAAIAATLAIRHDLAVQDIPYTTLRPGLEAAGQVLALG